MDLHGIVSGVIGAVNPFVTGTIRVSNGYTINAAKVQVPAYLPDETRTMQVQPLSATDLQKLDGMNLQGYQRAIYVYGRIDGLVRPERMGGDLIILTDPTNAGTWLTGPVLEQWADWVKIAVTLQNP